MNEKMNVKKKKKLKKLLIFYVIVILACVMIYSGYKIIGTVVEYKAASNLYSDASSQYISSNDTPLAAADTENVPLPDELEVPEYIDDEISPISVDFSKLQADAPEVVGWIYCPDTVLNYPVVQTENNQFYLKHMYNGEWNSSGSIFIDCKCQKNFSGQNTLVYGHHMNDYSMFTCLLYYKEQKYYDEHPYIYINTPEKNYRLEVFAAFVTQSDSDTYTLLFTDAADKAAYIEKMKSQSTIVTPVEFVEGDRFVTLSTCSYEFNEARFVVLCKLVRIH